MNKTLTLCIVLVLVIFFSCSKKKAEPTAITTSTSTTSTTSTASTTATTGSTTSTSSISYSKNVVPILNTNCYSCHSTANSSLGGGFALDTYSGFKMFCNPSDSTAIVVECITHNNVPSVLYMPNNGSMLASKDVATIVTWVFQGAKNN